MFEKERDRIRSLLRSLNYVMTIHAEGEMVSDGLSIFDVEAALLNGEIVEDQKDQNTSESKYLVAGKTNADVNIIVVTRFGLGAASKLVIIKVYSEENEYEN